jgi:hypothetical protein
MSLQHTLAPSTIFWRSRQFCTIKISESLVFYHCLPNNATGADGVKIAVLRGSRVNWNLIGPLPTGGRYRAEQSSAHLAG